MKYDKKVIFKEPIQYNSDISITNFKKFVPGYGTVNTLNLKECVKAAVYQSAHK